MTEIVFSQATFEALKPYYRGWMVYAFGNDLAQPNIPDEDNPYPVDSGDWAEWNRGQQSAVLSAQDQEE